MTDYTFDMPKVVDTLNRIVEMELAGVVRYTHYSFMVFGPNRIPITSWLRDQASESLVHAQESGELITYLGEHPSLGIGQLLETHKHDIFSILEESLIHESRQMQLYQDLLDLVKDKSVMFEEFARRMVAEEETHIGEVRKMMRK
ncbi:bacterioferritin [Vampirovibrio sp.]|uniref:ferritin-like domain-containing protein n=1 Tax=Vampirovibrio sp. TaxID=2717857 RepID=UPI0035945C33